MNHHLNQNEIADATLGLLESERAAHLETCTECRTRTDGYRAPLEQWRDDARLAAVQPDAYWARQRAMISVRRHERSFDRGLRFVWVGAVAALIVAAMLSWSPGTAVPKTTATTQEQQDEMLLDDVQVALERETPAALQPAEVLTQEMTRAQAVTYKSRH
jgi:anti-sigma factor RsiW